MARVDRLQGKNNLCWEGVNLRLLLAADEDALLLNFRQARWARVRTARAADRAEMKRKIGNDAGLDWSC